MSADALAFDEATHTYSVGGQPVPNVTLVTNALASYAGVPLGVLEAARQRGQAVHYATELYDLGVLDMNSVPDAVMPYLQAWVKFRDDTGFAPYADGIETRIYSPTFRYAGTVDRAGEFHRFARVKPGVGCMIDLKATYTVMAAVEPQTAAYMKAWNETREQQLRRRFAIQLKKDGTYHIHECKEPSDLSVFLAALTCHNWKTRNMKRGAATA